MNSTIGDPSAQSYLSVAEADAYFATRIKSDLWDALEDSGKEKALVTATRRLDAELYGSIKTQATQALQWPRTGLVDTSGYPISGLTIPANMQYATCEVAYFMLDEQMLSAYEMDSFSDWNVGSISVKINRDVAGQLPVEARQFLKAIGPGVWVFGKTGITSMVR